MNTSHRLIGLTLLMGLLSTSFVYGQDNIILKNGSEIQAKVLEVSPGQIKYRRQDNPDGPIYTTGTLDVLLSIRQWHQRRTESASYASVCFVHSNSMSN